MWCHTRDSDTATLVDWDFQRLTAGHRLQVPHSQVIVTRKHMRVYFFLPTMVKTRSRRRTLAAVGTAFSYSLAGCLGDLLGDGTQPSPTSTDGDEADNGGQSCDTPTGGDKTNDEPGEGFPSVRVEADDSNHEHAEVTLELIRQFDETAPARLRITFTNVSSEQREFVFGAVQPFSNVGGDHVRESNHLVAYPEDGAGVDTLAELPDGPSNGCWQLPENSVGIPAILKRLELAPCEAVSMEYDLHDYASDPCLAAGEYRFEEDDLGESGVEWGFSVFLTYGE